MKRVFFLLIGIFILAMASIGYCEEIKKAEFAGEFYPADEMQLSSLINNYLRDVSISSLDGSIMGVIVPHAGYVYSGSVAAQSYKLLQSQNVETVIILAPAHKSSFEGISIYPEGSFEIPQGKLIIDQALAEEFKALSFVQFDPAFFEGEHSVEVQLPFIATTLGNVKIVPMIFGSVTYDDLKKFGEMLYRITQNKKILVIVSTDLSHYKSYDDATTIDNETVELIKNKDIDSLWTSKSERACGINPIIGFLAFVKAAQAEVNVLKYANSGDTTGDKTKVVGYLSAVAYKPILGEVKEEEEKHISPEANLKKEGENKIGDVKKFDETKIEEVKKEIEAKVERMMQEEAAVKEVKQEKVDEGESEKGAIKEKEVTGEAVKKEEVKTDISKTVKKEKSVEKIEPVVEESKKIVKEKVMSEYTLTNEEKQALLEIARTTLETYLSEKTVPVYTVDSPALKQKSGVFVTLNKHGGLRGCIGRIVADTPLYKVVATVAIDAAINDPRFLAVTNEELEDIEIEISVITPFEKVTNIEDIVVGKHGLMIRKGSLSGLLLPQVPGEYGWSRKEFLENTCRKAGLPPEAYKDQDADLYMFSAIVFNEADFLQ